MRTTAFLLCAFFTMMGSAQENNPVSFDYTSKISPSFLINYKDEVEDKAAFLKEWEEWSLKVKDSIKMDTLQLVYKDAFKQVISICEGKEIISDYRTLNFDTEILYHSDSFNEQECKDDDPDVYKIIHFTPLINDNQKCLYWKWDMTFALGSEIADVLSYPTIWSLDLFKDGMAVTFNNLYGDIVCYFFPYDISREPIMVYYVIS